MKSLPLFVGCLWGGSTMAQTTSQVYGDTLTKQTQTFFMAGEAEWTTYQSELAEGHSSGQTAGFKIGGYTGESRVLGISLESVQQNAQFEYTQKSVHNQWNDLRFRARLGYFYPSIGVSLSELKLNSADQTTTHLYAQGYNGGLGARWPLSDTIVCELDHKSVFPFKTVDYLHQNGKILERHEANLNASIDVTKNLIDFLIGYRLRQFKFRSDENIESKEIQSAPFAGLRLGAYF